MNKPYLVRRAELSDCPAIVKLAMRAWPETPFPGDPPSEDFLFEAAERFVTDERNGAFVMGDSDAIHGYLAAIAFRHPFSGHSWAVIMAWWVTSAARGYGLGLFCAVEDWARQAGAVELHCYAHTPQMVQLCKLLKLKWFEADFVKVLQ